MAFASVGELPELDFTNQIANGNDDENFGFADIKAAMKDAEKAAGEYVDKAKAYIHEKTAPDTNAPNSEPEDVADNDDLDINDQQLMNYLAKILL